jgi:hypothetical protein
MNKFSIINKAILLLAILILPVTFAFSETANASNRDREIDDRSRTISWCDNSQGNDGVYNGCIGDTITHKPSKVKLEVIDFDSEKEEVKITLNSEVIPVLKYNETYTYKYSKNNWLQIKFLGSATNSGNKIFELKTIKLKSIESTKPKLKEKVTKNKEPEDHFIRRGTRDCIGKNFEIENGTYLPCINDRIKHKPTNASIRIQHYNLIKNELTIKINNSKNIVLKEDVFVTRKLKNGKVIQVKYVENSVFSGKFEIFVQS